MNFKKIIAFTLCILTLCLPLASCKDKTAPAGSNGAAPKSVTGGNINFEGAYKKFAPTDVVLTSSDGKYTVTWDVMYYFLCLAIEEINSTTGAYPDLSDLTETGYSTQIKTRAEESVLACLAIEYAADEAGAEITDDDRAEIAFNQELAEEQEGGADGFKKYLAENHLSYETYIYIVSVIDYLYENTVIATYGEGAKLFSDADTAAFLEDTEYLTVKQIYFSTTEIDGIKKLDDEALREKQFTAASVYDMLTSFEGGDFDAYFDSLMLEYSEDTTAINMYPNGYLFKADETYPALYDAASALEIGTYSGVIETELGFHIVYRLPVNYDIIPQGFAWDVKNTLRSQAARDFFGQRIENIRTELGAEATGKFYELDLADLFK